MRTHSFIVAALGALVLGPAIAGAAKLAPCAGGPFVVQGVPLLGGGTPDSDKVYIAGSEVSTQSGCPPVTGRVRATKRGTRVTARWASCGSIPGPHRFSATIDAASCRSMQGTLRIKGLSPARTFTASRASVSCEDDHGEATFELIQDRIFGQHGCNVSTCHGPFGQGELDLRSGAAYANLIDVPANNPTANAAGLKRVTAGNAADSFLSLKLHGMLTPGEGGQMPLVGTQLTQTELDLVDAWINGGAPETGAVAGAPCLPPLQYVPSTAPPKPKGGYQFVLDGPVLWPGEEQEGCYWIPLPNSKDFYTSKWEFALNPGTHHFAVFINRDDVPVPPFGQWLLNDFGCSLEAQYGANISGATEAPYYIDNYPAGIARVLPAGKYLGLNAHYHNGFDVPIRIKVWTNVYPYDGTPEHIAQTLTSLDTTFGIDVPPFTQRVRRGRFVNTLGLPMSFVQLSGHMHKRGLRFTAWRADGTKVYENFDWAHAIPALFAPPVVLMPGDWIDYECLQDNGVTRPLKLDASGNPTDLRFGVTTDDEMCILPGLYYDD